VRSSSDGLVRTSVVRMRRLPAIACGAAFGLVLYIVNMHGFTVFFPGSWLRVTGSPRWRMSPSAQRSLVRMQRTALLPAQSDATLRIVPIRHVADDQTRS